VTSSDTPTLNNPRLQGGGFKRSRFEIDRRPRPLAFLLVDVLVDHLISDRAGGDRKVAARPEVPTPELALEVRELLKEKARAGALEPLHDLADVLVRAAAEEQVHVVRGDFTRDDLKIVLGRDLP
jgi:hypothetical protein